VALSGSIATRMRVFPVQSGPWQQSLQHGQSGSCDHALQHRQRELERYQRPPSPAVNARRLYPIQHLRQFGGGGAKCTINVHVQTSRGGTRTAAVVVADTAVDSPQTVALSGTGDCPCLPVSPPLAWPLESSRRCHQLGSVGDPYQLRQRRLDRKPHRGLWHQRQ